MTQKELLTALKEWQKKKEIPKFDTKCLLTHDLKRTSKTLSCVGVFACAAYTNRLPKSAVKPLPSGMGI